MENISSEDRKKMTEIYELLTLTLKSSTTDSQRRSTIKNLRVIDGLINDINNEKWINPVRLKSVLTGFSVGDSPENDSNDNLFLEKIQIKKISPLNGDYEIDCIYSYVDYFNLNFINPIGKNSLKLNYDLSKKRDSLINKAKAGVKLSKDYQGDLEILNNTTKKQNEEYYSSKLAQSRKYLFLQVAEMFFICNGLFNQIMRDLKSGDEGAFSPDTQYVESYAYGEKSVYVGKTNKQISEDLIEFSKDVLDFLNIPGYASE